MGGGQECKLNEIVKVKNGRVAVRMHKAFMKFVIVFVCLSCFGAFCNFFHALLVRCTFTIDRMLTLAC